MNRLETRKLLYKSPTGRARGDWKDDYRKRCMARLRSSREKLIDKFRGNLDSSNETVEMIMTDELKYLEVPNGLCGSVSLPKSDDCVSEEEMKLTLAEIQKEMQDEEQRLIDDVFQFENMAFDSQINLLQGGVICPICQREHIEEVPNLWNHHSSISPPSIGKLLCKCGFTLQGYGLTLKMVQSSLSNTVERHGSTCSSPLFFSPVTESNTNILVTCDKCDWMSFLL